MRDNRKELIAIEFNGMVLAVKVSSEMFNEIAGMFATAHTFSTSGWDEDKCLIESNGPVRIMGEAKFGKMPVYRDYDTYKADRDSKKEEATNVVALNAGQGDPGDEA